MCHSLHRHTSIPKECHVESVGEARFEPAFFDPTQRLKRLRGCTSTTSITSQMGTCPLGHSPVITFTTVAGDGFEPSNVRLSASCARPLHHPAIFRRGNYLFFQRVSSAAANETQITTTPKVMMPIAVRVLLSIVMFMALSLIEARCSKAQRAKPCRLLYPTRITLQQCSGQTSACAYQTVRPDSVLIHLPPHCLRLAGSA